MDDLLELQQTLLLRNRETSSVVGGASYHGDTDSDEEIPSDSELSDSVETRPKEHVGIERKRIRPDWVWFSCQG